MDRDLSSKELATHSNGLNPIATTTLTNLGVSPRCMPDGTQSKDCNWFYMRVSYGREEHVNEYLLSQGIHTFYPTERKVVIVKGVRQMRQKSLIPNALFVYSTEETLRQYIGKAPIPYFHHFYIPDKDVHGNLVGTGRKPLQIPDSQMENFMKWCNADAENKLMVNTMFVFKNKDLVRVTGGPFTGFTGHVVRYKGQSRVGVNIDGIGFISTTYIPKCYLEKL